MIGPVAVLGLLAGLVLGPVATRADIFEWRDAQGVRHFTNTPADVPPQQTMRVVITEPAETTSATLVPPAIAPATAAEPPRQAQIVYSHPPLADAYVQGFEYGLALAARAPPVPVVAIAGPLAIAGPQVALLDDPLLFAAPLITTSFDRGRSRHRTLRMRLQEQFQRERDARFGFDRPVAVGVAPGCGVGRRVLFH